MELAISLTCVIKQATSLKHPLLATILQAIPSTRWGSWIIRIFELCFLLHVHPLLKTQEDAIRQALEEEISLQATKEAAWLAWVQVQVVHNKFATAACLKAGPKEKGVSWSPQETSVGNDPKDNEMVNPSQVLLPPDGHMSSGGVNPYTLAFWRELGSRGILNSGRGVRWCSRVQSNIQQASNGTATQQEAQGSAVCLCFQPQAQPLSECRCDLFCVSQYSNSRRPRRFFSTWPEAP